MLENTVYVGRPTLYGNPYPLGFGGHKPEQIVWLYRRYLETPDGATLLREARRELRGKDLACWCPLDQPCHADVLLEIANGRAP